MAVSGCKLSCAESWVRDIGLIGQKDGWALTVGGNVGAKPRIGQDQFGGSVMQFRTSAASGQENGQSDLGRN